MTLIPIIVTLILLALVILYVTRPLFTAQLDTENTPPENTTLLLESAYQDILERIRELDFEYKMGKLSQQEHEEQRAALVQGAAETLRELRSGDSPPAYSSD